MTEIKNYIQAGYPGLYLITHEEPRAEAMLHGITTELNRALYVWTCTSGLLNVTDATLREDVDEMEVLQIIPSLPPQSIVVLCDYHRFLKNPPPVIVRKLKEVLRTANKEVDGEAQAKTIIIMAPELELPLDIEKLITVVEFSLPDKAELGQVLDLFCESTGTPPPDKLLREAVLDAAGGMITTEAEDAYALSVIRTGGITPSVIAQQKAKMVQKNGLLELVEPRVSLDDIGGLEYLKADLTANRRNFTQAARDYGLPSPRPKLVVGMAGTGKSLTAQATGRIFDVPLLRLEAGSLFGSLVGESERNWRTAFRTVRAIAPCVLWIDEAEGLFSSARSGSTDGGTSQRVIKAILQDMQFHAEGVLFFFTANDLDGFPDALVDRMDVWGVDLPTQAERQDIWRIQILKSRRVPTNYDLAGFAKRTEGFSGRQIEQAWIKAMTLAFNEDVEPAEDHVNQVLATFVPTSVTMADQIEARRRRLHGKAKPASKSEPGKALPRQSGGRRIMPEAA